MAAIRMPCEVQCSMHTGCRCFLLDFGTAEISLPAKRWCVCVRVGVGVARKGLGFGETSTPFFGVDLVKLDVLHTHTHTSALRAREANFFRHPDPPSLRGQKALCVIVLLCMQW